MAGILRGEAAAEAAWASVSGVAPRPGRMWGGVEEACPGAVITSEMQERQYQVLTSRNHSIQGCHPLPGMRLIHLG